MKNSLLLRSLPFGEAKLAHEKQDVAECIRARGELDEFLSSRSKEQKKFFWRRNCWW